VGDLFQPGGQVAVFVQVADHRFGGVAHRFGNHADAQLRAQMIAQGDGRREERLERRLFDRFRSWRPISGIEVVVEEGAEIDLVERVGDSRGFEGRIGDGGNFRLGHGNAASLRHPGKDCR
jgi:hypothetical protein